MLRHWKYVNYNKPLSLILLSRLCNEFPIWLREICKLMYTYMVATSNKVRLWINEQITESWPKWPILQCLYLCTKKNSQMKRQTCVKVFLLKICRNTVFWKSNAQTMLRWYGDIVWKICINNKTQFELHVHVYYVCKNVIMLKSKPFTAAYTHSNVWLYYLNSDMCLCMYGRIDSENNCFIPVARP